MSYCSSLTDAQVENVLIAEKSHMERNPEGVCGVYPGTPHDGAVELYQEAREELLRRGIEPDEVLLGMSLSADEVYGGDFP